jgi:hypothetical protein
MKAILNTKKKLVALMFFEILFLCALFSQEKQLSLFETDKAIITKTFPDSKAAIFTDAIKNASSKYILTGKTFEALSAFLLKQSKEVTIIHVDKSSSSFIIETDAKYFYRHILSHSSILYANLYHTPRTEAGVIGYNRYYHGINMVDFAIPGATGKGIVVGVKEQRMDSSDLDLYKRVRPSTLAGGNVEAHATTIASLIGGAGNSFYNGRGIAYGCTFYPSSFANLFADDGMVLAQQKVSIQNHSYGTVVQQFYGPEAISYDAQCWQYKNLLHLFSAGNRGNTTATEGPYAGIASYANLTGNFKMAKNIVTVAAIDDKGNVAPLSSAGPAYDGRLVPQITALGANGTSDAAAIVSGTAAVMQQVYADSNAQQLPPASLIKAVIFNTADDVYRTGIDYKTGYGLLNSFEAIKAIQQKKYDGGNINQLQVWQKDINVPASAALKITLAWTDTTAAINNSKALVNDLDLEVIALTTNTVYKPWVLSTVPRLDSLEKMPVRKRDSLNTVEQVTISVPSPGVYQIKVYGHTVINPNLAFHIGWNIDTLHTFTFTNPRHTSDVNREENPMLPIRWKTAVADTNQTGTLAISYNNGVNWNNIQSGIKLYKQVYDWNIKDTSSTAQFRMQTSYGDFFSTPIVISKVVRPQIDFLCSDSFRISWNKHVYANGYDVYALTDSAYLKKIHTVTDSFAVFYKTVYPYLVYAVQPLLSNQIPAARSVAININQQGVNCFYKALNYTQLDSNSIRLSLELSTTAYIDSISFERISVNGSVLQTYGGRTVINNEFVYTQTADYIPAGLHYFRARIKLSSGAIIYSDRVSIISSGENSLWVYPNPINGVGTLNYFLRNQGQYFQLQLMLINGQILKQWEVAFSGTVRLPFLSTGIYFMRLVDANGRIAGATKLVVH